MSSNVMEDIQELRQLLDQSKRPRVQAILASEIEKLQKGVGEKVIPEKMAVAAETLYTTLDSFSWDQDENKVKIYIFLEGVSSDKVAWHFGADLFDVKVHDVAGRNYRFGVPKLSKPIDPAGSSVVVKPKRLIVTLKKAQKATWTNLSLQEDKLKLNRDDTDDPKQKDPTAGLIGLMKNMYDEGDDSVKRMIAQAWSKASGPGVPV